MRRVSAFFIPIALVSFACSSNSQTESAASSTTSTSTAASSAPMEETRAVAGGGISAAGWTGQIDASEASRGQMITNAKLATEGSGLRVTTGPAVAYWNPANTATGDYTVKATFTEPKYMNVNDHPHPYGVFIGGNDMGTAQQSYLYCAAYGNGNFIVRGFGPGISNEWPRGAATRR